MTNYENLCEAVGVRYITINACKIDEIGENSTYCQIIHPEFTAEKQIALINLISSKGRISFSLLSEGLYCVQFNMLDFCSFDEKLDEALAGLVLPLLETERLDKEEVRKVLK